MKKIIAVFVIMFAFTLNANAQEINRAEELAKKDTYEISAYLGLKGDILVDLQNIFKVKHEGISDKETSGMEESKVIMSRFVEAKFKNILTEEQINKLKGNKELYKKLIQN